MVLLEEAPASTRPVRLREPNFPVFPEFRDTSYVDRYDIFLTKLLRERLYDGACFMLTDRENGPAGAYREPNPELTFERFVESLIGRATGAVRTHSH